jgi:hypothetical protein
MDEFGKKSTLTKANIDQRPVAKVVHNFFRQLHAEEKHFAIRHPDSHTAKHVGIRTSKIDSGYCAKLARVVNNTRADFFIV